MYSIDDAKAKAIETQATGVGVPVDHLDLNHPQFPHDDEETQTPGHKRSLSRRGWFILIICFLIALFGVVIGAGKAGMDSVKRPEPATITPPVEILTKYKTTTLHQRSTVPILLIPDPKIITTTTTLAPPSVPPTPAPSKEAPKPELPKASSEPAKSREELTKESPKPEEPKRKGECFWIGRYSTKKECQDKCAEMNEKIDKSAVCGENRAFYQCQTCPAK